MKVENGVIMLNNELVPLFDDELMIIDGGINWGALADACANITIVSAVIAEVFPPAAAVTILCGAFSAGYYLGQAFKK